MPDEELEVDHLEELPSRGARRRGERRLSGGETSLAGWTWTEGGSGRKLRKVGEGEVE